MNSVVRIEDRLNDLEKPKLQIKENVTFEPGGALIICGGFEDRATGILDDLIFSKEKDVSVILLVYEPEIKQNKTNEIEKMCRESGYSVKRLLYPRHARFGIGEKILALVEQVPGKIIIDISGMSRLPIIQSIVAFSRASRKFHNLFVGYSEADYYPPDRDQVDQFSISGPSV